MPRTPLHELRWSSEHGAYELWTRGLLVRRFQPGDEPAWLAWLGDVTSLAFQGAGGPLNVFRERRPRGGRYWYAYHTDHGRVRKRYLGRTERVTLSELEQTALALARPTPPAAEAAQGFGDGLEPPPVPAAKLRAPRSPRALVVRQRLRAELDGALSTPLTLIAAPAGCGKTTLLADWAQQREVSIAWLSLDDADNRPHAFWSALIMALRRCPSCDAKLGEAALRLLQSPKAPPLTTCLSVLLQDLETGASPRRSIVAVLDDYQVITEPDIHESLAYWVEHLPAEVHLVLASREHPDLPLARWRVRAQMVEIGEAELCFDRAETAAWMERALGSPLSDPEVEAIQRRTMGWAAGLQLAALSLRHAGDRGAWIARWSGSQRHLLDYVEEEILARQPAPVRQFLLKTAVLRRLSAPLCQAVTGDSDPGASQLMLEALERANLFVVPLDEERQWYRLHDLVREALLAHLSLTEPVLLPELHLRAARHHEAAGDLREAIAHAFAALDFPYAARLIEQAAPSAWLTGDAETVQGWMASLPDADLIQHARLALQASLRLLESVSWTTEATFAHARGLVEPTLARLEALLARPIARGVEPAIERRLRVLRGLLASRGLLRRGDEERLARLAREIDGLAQGEPIGWQLVPLVMECWVAGASKREYIGLLSRLMAARARSEEAGELLSSLRIRAWLALVQMWARDWPKVEEECLSGLALIRRSAVDSPFAGYLHLGLGLAYYAWNRLDEAEAATAEVLRTGEDWQQVDFLIHGQLHLARLGLARGDWPAADRALAQVEALAQTEPYPPDAPAIAALRVSYWLAAGELDAARRWAERTWISPEHARPTDQWAVRMVVQVHLARREFDAALEVLEHFREALTPAGDPGGATEWLALDVVALQQAGREAEARRATARLLARTEPSGDFRLYLDLGEPMRQALQGVLAPASEPRLLDPAVSAYASRLFGAFRQEAGRSRPCPRTEAGDAARLRPPPTPAAPSPPLTPREGQVLQLLADGASNQEIARTLVISLATVKKHVGNVLGKLGATSRAQAGAMARSPSLRQGR